MWLGDPRDRRTSSGGLFNMFHSLERHGAKVERLGPCPDRLETKVGKFLEKAVLKFTGKRYDRSHVRFWARRHARFFEQRLAGGSYDAISAPFASSIIADLKTDIPIIYFSDTTFASLINYYPDYSNLIASSLETGFDLEQRSLQKSARVVYCSPWAAASAERDYGISPEKIRVYPLGANIDEPPTRDEALARQRGDTCRLLFLAKEWERKVGDIAVAALEELQRMGVKATLTVCGLRQKVTIDNPAVTVIKYLDKNDPVQRERFRRILLDSDYLFMPTRAECFGFVFCEAAANGLFVFSTDTGGIPGIVTTGKTGILLPLSAGGPEYAKAIAAHHGDDAHYRSGVIAARDAHEERLNWDAWARSTLAVVAEVAR